MDAAHSLAGAMSRIIGGIENAQGAAVDQAPRQLNRNFPSCIISGRLERAVVAYSSPRVDSGEACQLGAINPCRGIREVGDTPLINAEKLVETGEANILNIHLACPEGLELYFSRGDDAGETEAADGRREQRISGFQIMDDSVRPEQLEAPYVTTERTGDLMIFSMDIVRDRPTEGHVLRSRQYG